MSTLIVSEPKAVSVAAWIKDRGGVLIWKSIDLSRPDHELLTPATTDGKPTPKPHWSVSDDPTLVCDPDKVTVTLDRECRRFHVAVRRSSSGIASKLTDASAANVRRATEKAGPGAYHEFDYDTQEAVIFKQSGQISLTEWSKNCLLVAARVAEKQNDWVEATKIWDELDRPTDANACRMIADAIKAVALFRERARLLKTQRSLKQTIGG